MFYTSNWQDPEPEWESGELDAKASRIVDSDVAGAIPTTVYWAISSGCDFVSGNVTVEADDSFNDLPDGCLCILWTDERTTKWN